MGRPDGLSCDFGFYENDYGGTLCVDAFHEALPAALRAAGKALGDRAPEDEDGRIAVKRAICAAADAIAEYGEGQLGGFQLGDFRADEYGNAGTTGLDVAVRAALAELSGTGLAFCGVPR